MRDFSDKQRKFLREARRRCGWMVTHPERFPELYSRQVWLPGAGRARGQYAARREFDARVMSIFVYRMDLCDRRVGKHQADGSCRGLAELQIARWSGTRTHARTAHGPRSRRLQYCLARLHRAGYLEGRGDAELGRASNQRWPDPSRPGKWVCLPAVRQVSLLFLARLRLDRTFAAEQASEAKRRERTGRVAGVVIDLDARRARWRAIYTHNRAAIAAKRAARRKGQRGPVNG